MVIVADTYIYLAVALDEAERTPILRATAGATLAAPEILPFEMGNALSSLVKRRSLDASEALACWDTLRQIPVKLTPIDLRAALAIAAEYRVYAYDTYFLECAIKLRAPLLTLDRSMARTARSLGIPLLELDP